MNLIRIDARLRCTNEQAKEMVGVVDNVAFMQDADPGYADIHVTATSEADLLGDTEKALDRIQGALGAGGISNNDVLSIGIETEALVEVDGVWTRRDSMVPSILPAL